jgi:Protein of unknown function, DUF488
VADRWSRSPHAKGSASNTSAGLYASRQWFGHDVERWTEFRKRYRAVVAEQAEALAQLRSLARKGPITLLFGAHDELHNNAVVLHELLGAKERKARPSVKTVGRKRKQT